MSYPASGGNCRPDTMSLKFIRHTVIRSFASRPGGVYELFIGIFGVALSAILLLIWIIWQPNPVESYYVTDFSYSRAYLTNSQEYRYIALESAEKTYKIDFHLWQGRHSAEALVNKLSKHSQARLWLESKDDVYLQGLATPTLTIDPSVGAAEKNSDRRAILWMACGFWCLGTLILLVRFIEGRARNRHLQPTLR